MLGITLGRRSATAQAETTDRTVPATARPKSDRIRQTVKAMAGAAHKAKVMLLKLPRRRMAGKFCLRLTTGRS